QYCDARLHGGPLRDAVRLLRIRGSSARAAAARGAREEYHLHHVVHHFLHHWSPMHRARASLTFALSVLLIACERPALHEDGGEVAVAPTATSSDAAIRDSVKQGVDRATR